MKVISEACRAQSIVYLRFYYNDVGLTEYTYLSPNIKCMCTQQQVGQVTFFSINLLWSVYRVVRMAPESIVFRSA